MNANKHRVRVFAPILGVLLISGVIFAQDPPLAQDPPAIILKSDANSICDDSLVAVATVYPEMNAKFFKTTKTSYQPMIVEDDNGHLEDTVDGTIDAEDLLRIEHTASCHSSHQGEHLMEFCDAVATADGVKLHLWGGVPAYSSSLSVTIDAARRFTCAFQAIYPSPTNSLSWKIKKKSMRLKSKILDPGSRVHGWISVEFDEIDKIHGVTGTYKIEGYFKPVIEGAARAKAEASEQPTEDAQPVPPPEGETPTRNSKTPVPKR
jgi:hypothetical protein